MILNKTRRHSDRLRIINGNMGNHGDPSHSPTHKYHVVYGVGPNYRGAMSIDYFFKDEYAEVRDEARQNAIKFLLAHGYSIWLFEKNIITEEQFKAHEASERK